MVGRCSVGDKLLLRRNRALGQKDKKEVDKKSTFILYGYQSHCIPFLIYLKLFIKCFLCLRHGTVWSTTVTSSFINLIEFEAQSCLAFLFDFPRFHVMLTQYCFYCFTLRSMVIIKKLCKNLMQWWENRYTSLPLSSLEVRKIALQVDLRNSSMSAYYICIVLDKVANEIQRCKH